MNNVTIQAAIIAAAVAFVVALLNQIVAIINQILAHRLTLRRENQKYYNEVYQKLFATIIPEVFTYIGMVSNFRRRHDVSEERELAVKDKVIEYIGNNLLYASPKIVTLYHQIDLESTRDESGRNPLPSEIELLHEFVNEYEYVIAKASLYSGRPRYAQTSSIAKYKIWYLLLSHELENILSYSFWFSNKRYNNRTYTNLYKALKDYEKRVYKIRVTSSEEFKKISKRLNYSEGQNEPSIQTIYAEHYRIRGMQYYNNKRELYDKIINILVETSSDKTMLYEWTESSAREELEHSRQLEEHHIQLASIDNVAKHK
jgi:hypothetical protein